MGDHKLQSSTERIPPVRKTYAPPKIEEIEIVAKEAMLGFCKVAGAPGAFAICGGGCNVGGS